MRSTAMEGSISGGKLRVACNALVSSSGGRRTPRARPTAATSATPFANRAKTSGSSRSLPNGRRVSATTELFVANRMNFSHKAVRMLLLFTASNLAASQSACKAAPRALGRPSSSPNTRRIKVPVCRMMPGSAMVALICATPPITASLPRIGSSRSLASMPFCSGMTAVFGPTIGRIKAPALSTSQSLTQNSTKSTVPMLAGVSVTLTGLRLRSPRGLKTVRPRLSMAARCAPRATNLTSLPALASAAPKAPPTAPVPITAIRMVAITLPHDPEPVRREFTISPPRHTAKASPQAPGEVKPGKQPRQAKPARRRATEGPRGSAIHARNGQTIAMAGFQAGFDAGTGAQVINQPEAGDHEEQDNERSGKVLQGAAALVLIVQTAQWICDLGPRLVIAFRPAGKGNDLGARGDLVSSPRYAVLILGHVP